MTGTGIHFMDTVMKEQLNQRLFTQETWA